MWVELAVLGSSIVGYGAHRQRKRLTQITQPTKPVVDVPPRFKLRRLWRDTRDAMNAVGREELQRDIDPTLQAHLAEQQRIAKRDQKISIGAMGVAALGAYYPVLNLFGAAAVLYLARETFKLIKKDFQRGHYLSIYFIGLAMTLGMILTNHLILAAFTGVIGGFFARIVNRLEEASHHQLINVFGDQPEQVWILQDETEIQIAFQDLQAGDIVIVNPGEVIPIDGTIMRGEGQVDQHVLTGESQPAEKKLDEEVFAATLLLSGQLFIRVNTTGDATLAAKIGDVLNQTENYKDNLTARGRKIADRFLPLTAGLSVATLPILGPSAAIAMMWSELGGIMAPLGSLTVLNYLQILSRHNILVKDGRVFELIRDVDTVVFDKTGTLTLEQPTVGAIHTLGAHSVEAVLRYAAIAEYRQPHPIAKAILAKAAEAALDLPTPDEANYDMGYGIKVRVGGETIQVGSARYLQQEQIVIPDAMQDVQTAAGEQGHTLIYVAVDQQLAGILALEPTIRPEAEEVIGYLQQRGITLYIISGDHSGPTQSLAKRLGIDHFFADVLPERKADYVKQLKDEGRFVCFVGDGINDAIALKTAQVSISLKGASSAATDTAQVVFMDSTLKKLPRLLMLADDFESTMKTNLAISFVPGIVVIAGVYVLHFGIALSMAIFYIGCFMGLGNILWPLVKHQETLALPDQTTNESSLPAA